MIVARNTSLVSLCVGTCPFETMIGTEVFHQHWNALFVARYNNRKSGEKVWKVQVYKGHFRVVEVADDDSDDIWAPISNVTMDLDFPL